MALVRVKKKKDQTPSALDMIIQSIGYKKWRNVLLLLLP